MYAYVYIYTRYIIINVLEHTACLLMPQHKRLYSYISRTIVTNIYEVTGIVNLELAHGRAKKPVMSSNSIVERYY